MTDFDVRSSVDSDDTIFDAYDVLRSEDVAGIVECPVCNAAPGKPCLDWHKERLSAALDVLSVPEA